MEDLRVSSMKYVHAGKETDLQRSIEFMVHHLLKHQISEKWLAAMEVDCDPRRALPGMSNPGIVALERALLKHQAQTYYPRASEEHVPLSSHQGAVSAFSGRLLVDTNLDTSSPDTYRPPPAPIPFNVTSSDTQTAPVAQEIVVDKSNASLHSTNSHSIQEPVTGENHETSAKLEELKESECKVQTDLELDSAKDSEIELPKLGEPVKLPEEEDACPICLEEYDAENPKLTTKCDHHFHLACILEWMERSETCPVCDQEMVFDPPIE